MNILPSINNINITVVVVIMIIYIVLVNVMIFIMVIINAVSFPRTFRLWNYGII